MLRWLMFSKIGRIAAIILTVLFLGGAAWFGMKIVRAVVGIIIVSTALLFSVGVIWWKLRKRSKQNLENKIERATMQ